jgi:hypothetical protein
MLDEEFMPEDWDADLEDFDEECFSLIFQIRKDLDDE